MNFDDGILYDYNIEAYKKLMLAIEKDGKACAIHSTGTGKMYLALKWLIDNKNSSFAYVAPTNVILDKFLDVIINECFPDKKEELYACKTIEKRAEKTEKLLGNKIHLLTYAGINEKVKQGKVKLKADKIVLDEFHHLGADRWGSAVEAFLKYNEEADVLGLSATPIRSDKKNMVDELFDGVIASEITLKDALEKGILPVPTFIGAIYSFKEEVDKLENKFRSRKYSKETAEKIEKYIKEARKMIEEAGGLKEIFDFALTQVEDSKNAKFIVFCSDMDDKDNKMAEAKNWFDGNVSIRSVDYSLSKKESLNVIKEFEEDNSEGIKLLFSIDMLNEGLHVKDIDGVIMMRPTSSDRIFKQQLGRALSSGSKKGINPLVLDLVNNIDILEDDLENVKELITQYGGNVYGSNNAQIPKFVVQAKMMNIIDYLKSVAYTFEERIAHLKEYYKEKGSLANITQKETYFYNGKEINIGKFISRLRVQYRARNLEGENLEKARKNRIRPLTDEEVKILEEMGMIWDATDFQERIASLVAYYKEFGSISTISNKDKYSYKGKEINIGRLVSTLREQYKLRTIDKGKKDNSRRAPLTDEEVDMLDSMGMVWEVEKTFEKRIAPLIYHYEKESTIAKIKSHDKYNIDGKEVKIGDLVVKLRNQYKARFITEEERKKTRIRPLTDEEVETLEKMGMVWGVSKTFEERIAPLVAYYKENGNLLGITQKSTYIYKGKNVSIGALISNLRTQYKMRFVDEETRKKNRLNPLTDEEIELLESIGMVWNEKKEFKERIAPLVAYYKEFGSISNIEQRETYTYNGESVNIGGMISNLKKQYKVRSVSEEEKIRLRIRPLTDEEVEILEKLGMVWSPKSKR